MRGTTWEQVRQTISRMIRAETMARMYIAELADRATYDPDIELPQQIKALALQSGLMSGGPTGPPGRCLGAGLGRSPSIPDERQATSWGFRGGRATLVFGKLGGMSAKR